MSLEQCMEAVGKALGRKIGVDELDAFAERLETERLRLGGSYPADWLKAAQAIKEAEDIAKANAKKHVFLNKIIDKRLDRFIELAAASGVDSATALEAKRVGVNTPFFGARESVAALHESIRGEAWGAIINDLRAPSSPDGPSLLDLFQTRDFELQVVKAARGEADADPRARRIFESLDRVREVQRKRENRAGSIRGRLDGFAQKHHWDPRLSEKVGFEEWKRDFLAELDPEKTFNPDNGLQTALTGERVNVDRQITAAQGELRALQQRLTGQPYVEPGLRTQARQAGNRAAAAAGRERRLEGAVAEARRAMGEALGRYMDLADRERAYAGLTPLEAGGVAEHEKAQAGAKRAMDARLEARVALNRENARLKELNDRLAREKPKGEAAAAAAEERRAEVQQALDDMARIEKSLDTLNDLEATMSRLQKTLRNAVIDKEGFLEAAYNNIVTDQWRRSDQPRFEGVVGFSGPGNMAARRSEAHRVFHFKTAEGELRLLRKYSHYTMAENVFNELDHNARVIALLEEFGPNPENMHNRKVDQAVEAAVAKRDRKLANRLTAPTARWQLAEILGHTQAAHNETMASWASMFRAIQSMAKLGAAVISSFGDVVTTASEMKYQGHGALDGYGEALSGLVKGRREGDRRRMLDMVNVGTETLRGGIASRLSGNEHIPGWMSKKVQQFFRMNMLGWWTDTHKSTAAMVTMHDFAQAAGLKHAALAPEQQRLLKLYGIDERGWDILRRHGVEAAEDGTKFLTAEGARRAPLEEFMTLAPDREPVVGPRGPMMPTERSVLQARDRLASQWVALVKDRTDIAVPTPGAREAALINMGTQRGTPSGEALRFLMQFKSFPLALTQRVLGRELYGHGPGPKLSAVARMGALIAQLTVAGYLSSAVKDMLKGRDPRSPIDPGTWVSSAAQGGGFGIYGDFIFGEFNRFGRSALATAAGPTFGTADDLLEIWAKFRSGEVGSAGAELFRTFVANVPFANLFYVRPALDYFILWPLSEKMSPGWARRYERRVEKDNGQTFLFKPTEAVR